MSSSGTSLTFTDPKRVGADGSAGATGGGPRQRATFTVQTTSIVCVCVKGAEVEAFHFLLLKHGCQGVVMTFSGAVSIAVRPEPRPVVVCCLLTPFKNVPVAVPDPGCYV